MSFGTMRYILVILVFTFLLSSCGTSYSVPRATIHVELTENDSVDEMQEKIVSYLMQRKFIDLGIDEEMLRLLEWSNTQHEGKLVESNNEQIKRIHRTRHLKNEPLDIDVMLIDYSDPSVKERYVKYSEAIVEITKNPTLEINIHNYRAGGFSPEGHSFFNEFYAFVSSNYGNRAYIVFQPPETNDKEYYKTTLTNFLSGAFWWFIVYSISLSIFGVVLIKGLKRTRLSIIWKRTIFTIFGTLLVTPLPFPAATIFVIVMPSVLALPAIGSDYFSRVSDFAIPSFIVSAVICFIISMRCIKEVRGDAI
jgi:hypothetical protein